MLKFLISFVILFSLIFLLNAETTAERNALIALRGSTNHNGWVSSTRNGELSYDTTWNTANPVCGSGDQNDGAWFGVICVSGNIEVLLLASNNLVGTIPSGINGLTNLKQLYLFSNSLSGAIPSGFSGMNKLTHLYLWDNDMTSVTNIGGLTTLQKFYFERNAVTDSNINWVSTLPNLLEVDGSDNSITGTIPNNIKNAAALRKIDFSRNQLSGTIPYNLLDHPELIFVYLNDNDLVGAIPGGIDILGRSLKLQNLDFGNNDLRCVIPEWILQVDFPVDLRENRFFCPVPTSTFNLKTTPATCVQATQSGASITEHEIWGGAGSAITLFGSNLELCTTTPYQCKFNYQFGAGSVLVPATTSTAGSVTCDIPTFTTGGGRFVCIAQEGIEITKNCSYVFTFFDCSTLCKNGGFCDRITGECICRLGWKGPTCELKDCGDCNEPNGYCNTTSGECICNAGWIGPKCRQGNQLCNYTCEPEGFCSEFTGECVCSLGYQGVDCKDIFCPPCDTRGGFCANGTCHCYEFWSGVLCNVPGRPCPLGSDCGASLNPPRGRCDKVDGVCICFPGWEGETCDRRKCPANCSYPNGVCNTTTGVCSCEGFYQPPTCVIQRIPCPNDCSGNGICNYQTGKCSCRYPFLGAANCSIAVCNPDDCTGNGVCNRTSGECVCNFPYTGASCAIPDAPCPGDPECSGKFCNPNTGKCNCGTGYDTINYPDCSIKFCPGDGSCSGKGVCNNQTGFCECQENYLGSECQLPDFNCPDNCNENGFCNRKTGLCTCYVGFEGESCFAKTCNNNCTGTNGQCNTVTGRCICSDRFDGDDCSLLLCLSECLNGRDCDNTVGDCDCGTGFRGENCALLACPDDCSGHGTCVGGVCFCTDRYTTANCSVQEPDYPLIILVIILAVVGGLVLIGVVFMIWRQVMISNLSAQVANAGGAGQDLDAISDSS